MDAKVIFNRLRLQSAFSTPLVHPYRCRSLIASTASTLQMRPRPLGSRRWNTYVTNRMPRIAQASLWTSLIPRFLRRNPGRNRSEVEKKQNPEWNPATFFIIILILIGSNAMNLIALRREKDRFIRSADKKIDKLKEVIHKVQRGESVDVEAALGTGNPKHEKEWEEVLRQLEEDERKWAVHLREQHKGKENKSPESKEESTKSTEQKDHIKMQSSKASVKTLPSFY